jgi:3-methyladenine DNA glycosylase AlkC
MSTLLKDLYSPSFYKLFAEVAAECIPSFNKKKFTAAIFDSDWDNKELKARMRHTTQALNRFLPGDFTQAANCIRAIITGLRKCGWKDGSFEYMFLPDYIENFGADDFDTSVQLIEFVTPFTSCEFAVRPFIIKYGDAMMQQMLVWSQHPNHHVRRLASEGSRPRLPWAIALPAFKKDPAPILPLLENLKNDPSEYVRRSVANNLNDIAKDNPGIVIDIARQWKGLSAETDAIIRHGCRTLLKKAHPAILDYYELSSSSKIRFSGFSVAPRVAIGDKLEFSFTIKNNEPRPQTVRLEYGIYFLLQNGQLSRKVFKISERQLQPGEKLDISKQHNFKAITTRTFYAGAHQLSIIVNGKERASVDFELFAPAGVRKMRKVPGS